jgi:protein-tyrosine phosphatase
MTKIWERLFLGTLKDAEQLARSNPRRITTVISLCREQAVHRAPKVTYIHIPIPDSRAIPAQKFEDIMYAVEIGVRRGNLLVHCLAGMSRSPILMAAWMDRCGYAGIDKALAEVGKQREIAPAQVLLASVKGLLKGESKS